MKTVRTPDERFEDLPDYNFEPHFANVDGLRIAVIREGFGREESEADVDDIVRQAAKHLENQGAVVEEVSIPMHLGGLAIWGAIGAAGMYHTMFRGHGFGQNIRNAVPISVVQNLTRQGKNRALLVNVAEIHGPLNVGRSGKAAKNQRDRLVPSEFRQAHASLAIDVS